MKQLLLQVLTINKVMTSSFFMQEYHNICSRITFICIDYLYIFLNLNL